MGTLSLRYLVYAVVCLQMWSYTETQMFTTGPQTPQWTMRTTWWPMPPTTTPRIGCQDGTCNGGICRYYPSPTGGYGFFQCDCNNTQYTGKYCEIKLTTPSPLPTVSDSKGIGVECGTKICYNNGTCQRNTYNSYTYCRCPYGYTGSGCETKKCNARTDPCQNGRTCYSYSGKCSCGNWYSGSRCEIVNDCNPHVYSYKCRNGGTCWLGKCNCSLAYTGNFCETYRNCSSKHNCANNGTCHKGVCYCPKGYYGRFCENMYPTSPPVCECRNGNCYPDSRGRPKCYCFNGYKGERCDIKTNVTVTEGPWCQPENPCHNGGKCVGDQYDYNCKCDSIYYGIHCERNHVKCYYYSYGAYCQNGGTCRTYATSTSSPSGKKTSFSMCICKPGFKGDLCQTAVDPKAPWLKTFSDNPIWSGTYNYNKFQLPFNFSIEIVNSARGFVIATLKDKVTMIVMKGTSRDDIYITFNMTKLTTPSYRIPVDFEISGQITKNVKENKLVFKGKISRPNDDIFGAFTLSPGVPTVSVPKTTDRQPLIIGLSLGLSLIVTAAVVLVVVIIIRRGMCHHASAQFQHTRFSNENQKVVM